MYCIIKHVKNNNTGRTLPVIILNSDTEVWEFTTKEEAEKYCSIFQANSDSNHKYEVKKI
jgi:hypothetical protein